MQHLRQLLETGRPTVGGWCMIPSILSAEAVGRSGFDWVGVDTQHGLIGYETMAGMLQAVTAAGVPSVVRVSENRPGEIMKALDAGAHGIIVPLVNTAADAAAAVGACRYPPRGMRSLGPVRASWTIDGYSPAKANDAVVCLVQIETVEATQNAAEILSVPGVDGVFIGPMDLALSAGVTPTLRIEDMQHLDLIDRAADECKRRNLVLGTACSGSEAVIKWAERGYTFMSCGTDDHIIRNTCAREARMVHDSAPFKR